MAELFDLYQAYLQDVMLMQLATCRDGQPWLCNVWFVADEEDNIYWMSLQSRRHSAELTDNPHVAATFHKWYAGGFGEKGQALVMSGHATLVPQVDIERVYNLYVARHPHLQNVQTCKDFADGSGAHVFYQLTPTEIVWWDEINFPEQSRRVVLP